MSVESLLVTYGAPKTAAGNSASQHESYLEACVSDRANDPLCRAVRTTRLFFSDLYGDDTTGDGGDMAGVALTAATYNATTQILTQTGKFPSRLRMGDVIKLTGTGITTGYYMVFRRLDADRCQLMIAGDTTQGTRAAPLTNGTGITSPAGPYKTAAKAATLLNAASASANISCEYRANETWTLATAFGTISSKSDWTIKESGYGAKPFFNGFADTITTTWTAGAGNRYTHALPSGVTPSNIAWIRMANDRLRAFQRVAYQGATVVVTGTGTFTLTVGGQTATIAMGASTATVQAALVALTGIGTRNGTDMAIVTGTANNYTIALNLAVSSRAITGTGGTGGSITIDNDSLNVAAVQARDFSFYVSPVTNLLHANFGGLNPNTAYAGGVIPVEISRANASASPNPFISTSGCDSYLIRGLELHGFGQCFDGQSYSVELEHADWRHGIAEDLTIFYGGYHPLGTTGAGGAANNGCFTILNCEVGYATLWPGGATQMNLYNSGSGAEFIVDNPRIPFGCLPDDSWWSAAHPTRGNSTAIYSHTNDSNLHGLVIIRGAVIGTGGQFPFAPDTPIQLGGLPGSADVRSSLRAFVDRLEMRGFPEISAPITNPSLILMTNSVMHLKPSFRNSYSFNDSTSNGYCVNCELWFDSSLQTGTDTTNNYEYQCGMAYSGLTPKWAFCDIRQVRGLNQFSIGPGSGSPSDAIVEKCLISTVYRGATPCPSNNTNTAAALRDNLWYGIWDDTSLDGDNGRLFQPASLVGRPQKGFIGQGSTGQTLLDGWRVDVDRLGNHRKALTSRGAIETDPAVPKVGSLVWS